MIVTGRSRDNAGQLAAYLTAEGENERVWIPAGSMAATPDELRALLQDMETFALHPKSRCKQPLYHATINPEPGEEMDEARWKRAVEMLAEGLGMEGRLCAVVMHEKEGRQHAHVVFNRVDPETGKAWHDGHNYARHEELAERIAREFGHAPTPRAYHGREWDDPRPPFRPSEAEHQRAKRKGVKLADVKALVQEARQHSDSGASFIAALEDRGLLFARGDRRDYVIVDRNGDEYNAAKISGLRAAEMRAFMRDIDPCRLMSVADAKAIQALEREGEQAQEQARARQPETPQPVEAGPVYRDDAETARQLEQHDRANAVGQARAGFQEAQHKAAEPSPRGLEQRAHEERAEAFAAVISDDPAAFFAASRDLRVMVAYDKDGRFFAVTSRVAVELTEEQGQRALSAMNAKLYDDAATKRARLHLLNPHREVHMPRPLRLNDLPKIEDAKRLAYGLEKQAERRDQVRAAFDEYGPKKDNGRSFFYALKAQGMTVRPDYAGRLHVSADGHAVPLTECVSMDAQRASLGNMAYRVRRLRFLSQADREDSFAQLVAKVSTRRALKERDQAVRAAVRAVSRPARAAASKVEASTKAVTGVTQSAANVLEIGVRAVSSIFEDWGKPVEREEEAKAERPAPTPPAPHPVPPSRKRDIGTPITQPDLDEARHSLQQSADLEEIYRRNAEDVRRRMAERNGERDQELDGGRERDRSRR